MYWECAWLEFWTYSELNVMSSNMPLIKCSLTWFDCSMVNDYQSHYICKLFGVVVYHRVHQSCDTLILRSFNDANIRVSFMVNYGSFFEGRPTFECLIPSHLRRFFILLCMLGAHLYVSCPFEKWSKPSLFFQNACPKLCQSFTDWIE